MRKISGLIISILVIVHFCACQQDLIIEKGVSLSLAGHRKEIISDIRYQLDFSIPPALDDNITATEIIN